MEKLKQGWYVFHLKDKDKPIGGPFELATDAEREAAKHGSMAFVGGVDMLNRRQRRQRAKQQRRHV